MAQIIFKEKSGIQDKMIEVLKRQDVHAMVLFAFARTKDSIQPLIVISNDFPNGKEFYDEFYTVLDKYLNLAEIYEKSKEEMKE